MAQRVLWVSACFLFGALPVLAGDKQVHLDTTPPGAQVEVNGNVTCTTPCVLKVPSYYFGKKRTAFSSHGIEPIRVRLTKAGYVPKTVDLTVGPIHWKNLYGNNLYDYYLVTSEQYRFQLEPVQDLLPESAPQPGPALAAETTEPAALSTEQIVRKASPAVVQVSTSKGSGSGFFVTPDGVVVTNAHVVDGQNSATVVMSSGRSVETTLIYSDADRDLAILKIAVQNQPFLTLRTTLPSPGSEVIAIGTPGANDVTGTLLLPNTVTKGIVSGIRRFPEETTESVPWRAGTWIQTDATINHGNSGGPLLDKSCQVVGINTLAFGGTGTPGVNFSLAASELASMIQARFGVKPSTVLPPSAPAGSALVQTSTTRPDVANTALGAPATGITSAVSISSTPDGADIEVDGVFLGNTPATLPLAVGQRSITVSKKGFKSYKKTVLVLAGGTQKITAELDPEGK